jgi:branched-chain amino acid transport system ATP-binding protein
MLELHRVSAGYGSTDVIHDIDLTVGAGEIVTLVGANGAGKSTLVKAVSGLLYPRSGAITFQGRRIEALPTRTRVRLGIAHVPEGRQVFAGLTVAENLSLGSYVDRRRLDEVSRRLGEVQQRFPVLKERLPGLAGNLSGGQQQMLAIGRGLMAGPKLLILDEPSLGLSPLLVTEIFDLIAGLRQQGLSILLAEQNARMSLAIADRGYVIENGRVMLSGKGSELLQMRDVAERYLGIGAEARRDGRQRRDLLSAKLREAMDS